MNVSRTLFYNIVLVMLKYEMSYVVLERTILFMGLNVVSSELYSVTLIPGQFGIGPTDGYCWDVGREPLL